MSYTIVGLGNPGEEYEGTRHNTGAFVVRAFVQAHGFSPWKQDKKLKALVSEGMLQGAPFAGSARKEKVTLVLPQTFMNKSGLSVTPLAARKTDARKLVVVYDDLDLPLGRIRISFGRSSGGHKGVESVMRSIGTKDFVRVRVGIAPATAGGVMKKPAGEKKVLDFIMGTFTKKEREALGTAVERATRAFATIVTEGKEKAMQEFN